MMTNQEPELRNTCQRCLLQGDQLFNRISLYFRKRFILNVASAFMIHPSQLRHHFGAYLWCCSRVKQETARKYFKRRPFPDIQLATLSCGKIKKKWKTLAFVCGYNYDRDSSEHTLECWSWIVMLFVKPGELSLWKSISLICDVSKANYHWYWWVLKGRAHFQLGPNWRPC